MKRAVRRYPNIFWIAALAVLWALPLRGQSVPEIRIENTAEMQYQLLNGLPLSTASNRVSFVVRNSGLLILEKTVFPVAALPGDTLTFTILVGNEGTASLANVRMSDSLPSSVSLVSANRGAVQGSIVSETWSLLEAGRTDTLIIRVRVLPTVVLGALIVNTAQARDSSGVTITATASAIAAKMTHFTFTGSASPKPVRAGDTLTYSLHYGNDGNAAGTGVRIYYAVPNGTRFVSASNNGQMTAGVVQWEIGNLAAGASGDVQMKVSIPSGMANKSRILNIGLLNANGGVSISSNQDTTMVYRILPVRLRLLPNPRSIVGNGIDNSVLTVTLTDSLGQPVPNGTPVALTTTAGKFSNGLQSITLLTINGIASTLLTADLVSNQITTAIATATAGPFGGAVATDFVSIVFYPGAITGKVTDNRTGKPVDGAVVEVRSNTGLIIGTDTTKAGNPYLVPIARADTFRTTVTATDAFGNSTVSAVSLFVAVPGVGGIPPTPNGSSIGGTVFDPAAGSRAAKTGLLISLFSASGVLGDTVRSDQKGNYVFNNVPAGHWNIALIERTDTARVSIVNLTAGEFVINANLAIAIAHPELRLTKTASADTVMVGDTLRYVLRFQNSGSTVLTNVIIRDTLPASLSIPAVSGNAQRSGNTVSITIGSMAPGVIDSVRITALLRSDLPDRFTIVNTASAESDQTPIQHAGSQVVARTLVPDHSCRLILRTTPGIVIGNGIGASVIEASLSDTMGRTARDGTPVEFRTTRGFFSNGLASITVPTVSGLAVDSVRALSASGSIDTAHVAVFAGDPADCTATGTVSVVFYPGAIYGSVQSRQTRRPVENALIRVHSSAGELVGSVTTGADGGYLVPVPRTDSYRVAITTKNEFGETTTASTNVSVVVPGAGGNPPVSGNNEISGSVFYSATHRPIPTAGIRLLLSPIATNAAPSITPLDSVVTDSTGAYRFENVPPGTYEVAISNPWIRGKDTVQNSGGGEVLIDVNIAAVLNPSLSFSKHGPAQQSPGDTAIYTVTARNLGTLPMTNTLIIDSLDARMNFIDATGRGTYESTGHRIVWHTGILPAGTQVQYTVRVAFPETFRATFTAKNVASITSDEIIPTITQAATRVSAPSRLGIWKTSSVSSAQPGDTVAYTIMVEHGTGATTDSIRVTDALPPQVRFLAATPPAQYDSSAHHLRWFIDSLGVDRQWKAVLQTIVRTDLPAGEVSYSNTADLLWRDSTATSESDPRSNSQVTTVVSYLQVSKQAVRKLVDIGDFAGYVVRVTNTSATSVARQVVLTDRIPFGFAYAPGSSVLDSGRAANPTGTQELRWSLTDSLPPNTTVTLSYRLVVGAGGIEGNGVNTAQASATTSTGLALRSAAVSERVEVRRGVFTDRGFIIGKVFYDDNRNRQQDENEEGVKNVELMMEDGTRIVTGDDGKYSLPDVPPGRHVIKVRQHTLPEGVTLLEGYGPFAGDASSRFVPLTESNIARADFYLARKATRQDSVAVTLRIGVIGTVRVQRITKPRNIVFVEDENRSPLRLAGNQFEVGKGTLRYTAIDIVHSVGDILRDYPDQHVWISGHSGSLAMVSKMPASTHSLFLADAVAVRQYLIKNEGIESTRITTVGFGPDQTKAPGSIAAGKANKRRIEFYFGGSSERQERSTSSIEFRLPITYEGAAPVQRIVIHDVLDTLFRYQERSATLGDQPISPRIDGRDLYWTVNDIGVRFNQTLVYRVTVDRPRLPLLRAHSRSSVIVAVHDNLVVIDKVASVTNEVALAGRGEAVNFILPGVLFEAGEGDLRPAAFSALWEAAEALKSDSGTVAIIEGHTDSAPLHTSEFMTDVQLSRARAQQVAEYLVQSYGIARERLEARGWGSSRPVASNGSVEGRQANHRIEIRIYKKSFVNASIHEGFTDSSSVLQQAVEPQAGEICDTLATIEAGAEFVLKLEAHRCPGAVATLVLVDSLDASFALVPMSVIPIRGIDSVANQLSFVRVVASLTDSTCALTYRVAANAVFEGEKDIQHSVNGEIVHEDGAVTNTRSTLITVRIRNKR